MRWAILPALALLPACGLLTQRERVVLVPCSPVDLTTYSRDDQARLARELAGLGPDTMARRAIEDAGGVRAQLRIIHRCGDINASPANLPGERAARP